MGNTFVSAQQVDRHVTILRYNIHNTHSQTRPNPSAYHALQLTIVLIPVLLLLPGILPVAIVIMVRRIIVIVMPGIMMMTVVAMVILLVSMVTIVVTPVSFMIVTGGVSRPVIPGPLFMVWRSSPLSLVIRMAVTMIVARPIVRHRPDTVIGTITARVDVRQWSEFSKPLHTLVWPLSSTAPLYWSFKDSGRVEGM